MMLPNTQLPRFLENPTRHYFFTGKGGVGKTTVACASALFLARSGKKVLLVSTDPASNIGQVFGLTIGNRITPVPDVPGLVAVLTYYTLSADQLLNNPWITYASWFFILSCGIASLTFIGFLLYSILYQALPRRKDFDFVIIHGAGLLNGDTVTPLLKGRADRAIQVYRRLQDAGKRAKIIPSGGQGADELVSEDQAISTYLQSQGVPPADILLEDGSATTEENLLMSKKVGEALVDNPKLYT